ncbi:hypothetical protein SeLEV6574_g01538 [Synchytrium endobioticum]|uniref:Uncharacterized protein n=1 Tax=Synchytrium endobioticum TaxID=286115 RepID=A0A507DC76_9FUNG|nr:hypothetical protein SeLEV6574_g01538 [Synchytrium endobioticum]
MSADSHPLSPSATFVDMMSKFKHSESAARRASPRKHASTTAAENKSKKVQTRTESSSKPPGKKGNEAADC